MTSGNETDAPFDVVYYDGHCALCHRAVLFLLRRDPAGERFRFAPLQGERFAELWGGIPDRRRPESIRVETVDGHLLAKSEAVVHLLGRLGGICRVASFVLGLVPGSLRNFGYDAFARIRYRVFGTREEACPVVPARLRKRFLP